MNLERELSFALRRKQPRAGFSDRVLERIDGSPVARSSARRRHVFRGAVAAALALAVSTGLWLRHESDARLERAQGEAAKQLAIVALRIASEKANLARDQVRATGTKSTLKETDHEQTLQN